MIATVRALKRAVRRRSPWLAGWWDARRDLRDPTLYEGLGGPFNGQLRRQEMVRWLFDQIPFKLVVETGTHRGATTAFLRSLTDALIHTVESNPRYYFFARARFRKVMKLKVHRGDSRALLAKLAASDLNEPAFFYLDAHWEEDLPLAEEVILIADRFRDWLIVIDDFKVPDDPGYGYDSYGVEETLELSYLPHKALQGARIFFPSAGSSDELNERGCVILASGENLLRHLDNVPVLREWREDPPRTELDGTN